MDIAKTYAVDKQKENEGTWIEIGDARFLVARAGNKAYVKRLTREVNRNNRALERKDDAADALSERIMIDVIAHTILLDWEGVESEGQPLAYSVEEAKAQLAYEEFRREIMKAAEDFSAYKAHQDEDDEKN